MTDTLNPVTQAVADAIEPWMAGTAKVYRQQNAYVAAQRAIETIENSRSEISEDKHEKEMLQVIDERDRAQEAMSQAYYLITGHSPEWSNHFGYVEALEGIDDAQRLLRESLPKRESGREELANGVLSIISKWNSNEISTGDDAVYEIDCLCKKALSKIEGGQS